MRLLSFPPSSRWPLSRIGCLCLLALIPACFAQEESNATITSTNANETVAHGGPMLRYLPALEAYRTNPENHHAFYRSNVSQQTVDLVAEESPLMLLQTSTGTGSADYEFINMQGTSICHMIEMNRYGLQAGPQLVAFPTSYPLESMAAVIMALEHLNTGNGVIVPEIEGLSERCNVRFTSEFFDTVGSEHTAMEQVIAAVQERQTPRQQQPCAFQGAFRSSVNVATALYTSLMGYPQVSTLTYQPELSNQQIYPLYGSLSPINTALPLLQFVVEELGIDHMAVVYDESSSALVNWANPLREMATEYYPEFVLQLVGYSYKDADNQQDFETTVRLLEETGFKYIFSAANANDYEALIRQAYKQGIAGTNGYTWITWVGIAQQFLVRQQFVPDDPMFLAARGMIIFDATLRSIPGIGRYDAFLQERAKMAQHPADIAFFQSKVPQHPDEPGYDNIFAKEILEGIGRFTGTAATLYDATIALGLGACAAAHFTNPNTTNTLDGPTHYQGFINVSFVGATGLVQLDKETGSRDATSNLYAITNMVPVPVEGSNNMTFREVKTHFYDQGKYIQLEDIVFVDGSTTPPDDLPPVQEDTHTIGTGIRALGLVMGSIALVSSLGCATWTFMNQSKLIVKSSQPIFLLLLCAGVFLMALSIIPMSLDDAVVENPDPACTAIPWLLSLGWCISFSALFSKTRRVNIIFHNPSFKRVKVNAVDVMRPMVVLLALNIVILAIWTGVAPLEWKRTVTEYDVFGRPSESVGKCTSDPFWPFVAPIIVINLGALLYAMNQAYVARKISTEFAESDWIARAMSFIMVVSFVAFPVLLIVEEDTSAAYFVGSALVFVVCTSVLGFIFVPKIIAGSKSVTQASIRKSMQFIHGGGTTSSSGQSAEMTLSRTSGESDHEGALILDHPKKYQEMRQELEQLKLFRKEWEKEHGNWSSDNQNADPSSKFFTPSTDSLQRQEGAGNKFKTPSRVSFQNEPGEQEVGPLNQ